MKNIVSYIQKLEIQDTTIDNKGYRNVFEYNGNENTIKTYLNVDVHTLNRTKYVRIMNDEDLDFWLCTHYK